MTDKLTLAYFDELAIGRDTLPGLVEEFTREEVEDLIDTLAVGLAVHSFDERVVTRVEDPVPGMLRFLTRYCAFSSGPTVA